MLPARPISKRASAPKTRSGCLTCKARRVKCDESKPICKPCTKSLRECLWKRSKDSQPIRTLVPITPRSPSTSQIPELLINPSSTLHFRDTHDTQYFRVYQEVVSRELAAALRTSPWVESVLRACHTSPAILQTVVALGALNKSMKMLHFARSGPEAMKPITVGAAASHRAYAIAAYGRAISEMRKISSGTSNPTAIRHLLLFGLLVHCMEEYLGSPKAAFEHSQAGYRLLLGWIASNPSTIKNHNGLDSPNTSVLEYPILQEYTRLDADHALSVYWEPPSQHQQRARARYAHAESIQNMPTEFHTLDEAQSYQEMLVQRTSYLIAELTVAGKAAHQQVHHPQTADFPGQLLDPCHIALISKLIPEKNAHLASLQAWIASFAPLLSTLSLSPDTHLSVGSAILQTRVIDLSVTLSSFTMLPSTSTDIFLPHHAEILSLIRRSLKVTPHVQVTIYPVFQTCTTFHHPLANLLPNCRDQSVRRQTLEIVLKMSPRDGDMDRRRWVHRTLYLVALEETGRLPNGTIPEEKRYHQIWNETYKDPITKERTYTVVCGRRVGYPIGQMYPAKWAYRFKTFTEEAANTFVVEELAGELVSDDDVEGIERERKMELARWPKGLEKPGWLKWEEVHGELKERVKVVAEEVEIAVREGGKASTAWGMELNPDSPGWVT